jgi:DNA gyrase subunit A
MLLATKEGMVIRFATADMPLSSRTAQGVKGMKLNDGDEIFSCLPIKHNSDNIAAISVKGLGKQVELKELTLQNRGGKGLSIYKEPIAGIALVDNTDDLLIFGDKTSIRFSAKDLPVLSRSSVGNSVIKNNSKVVSISKA